MDTKRHERGRGGKRQECTAWRHFTQGSEVHLQAGGSQLLMTSFPPQLYYLSEGPNRHHQYVPHSLMVIVAIIELYCIIPL